MKRVLSVVGILTISLLTGCSRQDQVDAQREAHQAGQEIKRDLQEAKQEVKKDAHEVSREVNKDLHEAKREVNSH